MTVKYVITIVTIEEYFKIATAILIGDSFLNLIIIFNAVAKEVIAKKILLKTV